MSWVWYPGAKGYEVADRTFNPAVGCTNVACTERAVCWARRFSLRQIPHIRLRKKGEWPAHGTERGCFDCWSFHVHEHLERWEKFRAKPNERIALAWGGDLFDPGRPDHVIQDHLTIAESWNQFKAVVFLLQTRYVNRALGQLQWSAYNSPWFQIGTSFTSPADLENVRALARLPEKIVRFIAFEPCNRAAIDRRAVESAKPDWAYIGLRTPRRGTPPQMVVSDLAYVGEWLNSIGCAVVYKRSCGPELYRRNEGTVLP